MIRKIGKTDNLVILKKPFDNVEVLQLAHTLTPSGRSTTGSTSILKNSTGSSPLAPMNSNLPTSGCGRKWRSARSPRRS